MPHCSSCLLWLNTPLIFTWTRFKDNFWSFTISKFHFLRSAELSNGWECHQKRCVTVLLQTQPSTSTYFCSKLSQVAAERCEEQRREFAFEIGNYPPEYLVAADEAAVNILTTYRENGWALQGLCARKKCCFVRGTRSDSLLAIL